MNITPAIVFLLAGLTILVGHWFPWRLLLGRDLHRAEAYVYGVASIVGPVLAAFWVAGERWAGLVLAAGVLGAGGATFAAKSIDRSIEREHELKDLKDRLAYADSERLPADSTD